jgi:hypothetical protein
MTRKSRRWVKSATALYALFPGACSELPLQPHGMRPQSLDLPDFHSSPAASFHVASILFFRSAAHIATDDGRSVNVRPVWRSAPALHFRSSKSRSTSRATISLCSGDSAAHACFKSSAEARKGIRPRGARLSIICCRYWSLPVSNHSKLMPCFWTKSWGSHPTIAIRAPAIAGGCVSFRSSTRHPWTDAPRRTSGAAFGGKPRCVCERCRAL